jgi:hypothetical protein
MSFQSAVQNQMGFGVQGEIYLDSPSRITPYLLNSADAAYNEFGRAFTLDSAGVAKAGGTGFFVGIGVNPKEAALSGTAAGGSLAPTLKLRNGELMQMLRMGYPIIAVPGAASIGDQITYNTTTGILGTRPQLASFTGVIAVTTGVLTVTGLGADEYLAVGSVLNGTGVPGGTVVTAQLTGTAGKDGTYQTNIITAVSSTTMTAQNSPLASGAGYADVPNAVIDIYAPAGAGLAVAKLTN